MPTSHPQVQPYLGVPKDPRLAAAGGAHSLDWLTHGHFEPTSPAPVGTTLQVWTPHIQTKHGPEKTRNPPTALKVGVARTFLGLVVNSGNDHGL